MLERHKIDDDVLKTKGVRTRISILRGLAFDLSTSQRLDEIIPKNDSRHLVDDPGRF